MRLLQSASLILLMVLTLAACGGPVTEEPAETAVEPVAEQAAEETAVEPLPVVDVPAEGIELDPPVMAEQIPEGAWYCEMETVHYARMDASDEPCPVCGMELVQKVAAVTEEPAPEPEPETEGEA